MSLEAIKQVTETEQQGQQRKAEAAAAAKKAVADAERDGKARLAECGKVTKKGRIALRIERYV